MTQVTESSIKCSVTCDKVINIIMHATVGTTAYLWWLSLQWYC